MTTRRTLLTGAAWSVPVILVATAAPAAAASGQPPVPVCLPLLFTPLPGEEFKGNNGQGFTLVKGTGVVVTNTTGSVLNVAVGFWTSAHQDGARLVTSVGDTLLVAQKDGNRASVVIELGPQESRQLHVVVDGSKAEAHLVVDCSRFIFKAVQA